MLYQKVLAETTEKYPESIAVIFNDTAISYQTLKQDVDVVAENLWRLGIRTGDCLSTYLPNCLENLVFNLALFKLGAVSVPIRSQLQAADISYIVSDAKPIIIVTSPALAPELQKALGPKVSDGSIQCFIVTPESLVPDWGTNFSNLQIPRSDNTLPEMDINPDAEATVLYTSGSTGNPKGAVHTYAQWLSNAVNSDNFHYGDVTYVAISINHCHGFGEQVLPGLLNGATMMLFNGFNRDDFIRAVTFGLQINGKTFKASSFYGVPSMYHKLAQLTKEQLAAMPAHNLRHLDFAGDVLPAVIRVKIRELFGNILNVTYGMSEAMCISKCLVSGIDETAVIGRVRPGVSLKIYKSDNTEAEEGEAGELCITGPLVCVRYLNSTKREEDTINGYFRTGDIVKLNELGKLVYINRSKRIIVTANGYNLNPSDIEVVLNKHPEVSQSCAFDIHDASGKLLIIALASLTADAHDVSAGMLFALFEGIETQHRPNVVSLVNNFELGNTGKIKWQFYQTNAREALAEPKENSQIYYDSRNSP